MTHTPEHPQPRRRPSRWLAAGTVLAILTIVVVVALSMTGSGEQESEGPRGPQPVPTGSAPSSRAECDPDPDVVVSTSDELVTALAGAEAGTSIRVEDGSYPGNFVLTASGTQQAPVELCGSPDAVLDGGAVDGGYTMHLDGAAYWRVIGLSLRGGQKGLMADGAVGNVIDGISVTDVGDEAIHLRSHSTDNVVQGTTIRNTGLRREKFGEGLYIGSAESNWCDLTDCEPDRSDRNVLQGNDIAGTTSEAVDIKEGTTDGVLRDNTFSGESISAVDSWVDVKGNSWEITGNEGDDAPEDGFQVHEILDGWGEDNVFSQNVANVDADGYGFNVTKRDDGNTVMCSNSVSGADEGLATIDCT